MWYALYCPGVKKESLPESCLKEWEELRIRDTFVFTCERMRRYQGAWHLETVPMFPDYVFLEGEENGELSEIPLQNKSQSGIRRRALQEGLIPVRQKEQQLLQELCGPAHHMPMSRGVIARGETHVVEGPLMGREQMIRRIDRHKRLAFLDGMILAGQQVKAGLEITEKTV